MSNVDIDGRSTSAPGSQVQLVDPTSGSVQAQWGAFEPGFRGGVQTALGDLDGDGRPEVVAASGPGRVGEVRVFGIEGGESATTALHGRATATESSEPTGMALVRDRARTLTPYGQRYRGGLAITSGDFDGDGLADIAVARSDGKGQILVFASRPSHPSKFKRYRAFTATPTGPSQKVMLAAGDFGTHVSKVSKPTVPDGRAELVVARGTKSATQVQIRDVSHPRVPIIDSLRVRDTSGEGVYVSVALVSKDGIPDLVVSQRDGKRAQVVVYDGTVGAGLNPKLAMLTTGSSRAEQRMYTSGIDTDGDGRVNVLHVTWLGHDASTTSTHVIGHRSDGSVTIGRGSRTENALRGPIGTLAAGSVPGLVTTASGLQYIDVTQGAGTSPSRNYATALVTYDTWLLDGTLVDRQEKVTLRLDDVVPGLAEGIRTMTLSERRRLAEGVRSMAVGGRRQLIIPSNLAYGAAGTPNIPPNSTVVIDVQLLQAPT